MDPTPPAFTTSTTAKWAYVLPLSVEIDAVLARIEAFQRAHPATPLTIQAIPLPSTPPPNLDHELDTVLDTPTLTSTIDSLRAEVAALSGHMVLPPQPMPRFIGSAWSKLATSRRWSVRVQGNISRLQWELLMSPWKLSDHLFWRQVEHCDWLNQHRLRTLTKLQRRKLNRAIRKAHRR